MSEVAAQAGCYIRLQPDTPDRIEAWASQSAQVLEEVLACTPEERSRLEQKGIENARRFNQDKALDAIEQIYVQILEYPDKR